MEDEKPENVQPKDCITWDDLVTEKFVKPLSDTIHQLQLQEVKMWPMRWAIMVIATILLILIIAYSLILFLLTKNPLTLLTPTGLTPSIFVIVRYLGRFLLWTENDYRLAEKKLEFKMRKLELKYARKNTPYKPGK